LMMSSAALVLISLLGEDQGICHPDFMPIYFSLHFSFCSYVFAREFLCF
jgi:hypothetical protein